MRGCESIIDIASRRKSIIKIATVMTHCAIKIINPASGDLKAKNAIHHIILNIPSMSMGKIIFACSL